jgi:aryl-alcohol dehydrogenase-like predicted oxidoreductase
LTPACSRCRTPSTRWRNNPRFAGDNFARNQALVERVEEIARRKGVTPSQIALAWVLAQGHDIVPIPGTKQRKYLEENARAAAMTLTPEERRDLDEVFAKGVAAGERYPEGGMRTVNR